MAAITAVMMLFDSGDHVILTDDVYGGTYRVMTGVLNRFGIEADFVDTSSEEKSKGHSPEYESHLYRNTDKPAIESD